MWEGVEKNDVFYSMDSVFTDMNASATVRFEDKTTINLSENTLIIISKEESQPIIDIRKGITKITASSKPVQLVVKGVRTQVKGKNSSFQISSTKKGISIAAIKGSIDVKVGNKTTKVEVGTEGKIDQKGEISEVRQIPVIIKSPTDGYTHWEKGAVPLRWVRKTNDSAVLEVSKTPIFSKTLKRVPLPPKKTSFAFSTKQSGAFYWRIKTDAYTSETRKFTIPNRAPPTHFTPTNGSTITAKKCKGETTLRWSKIDDKKEYHAEVAKDANFKKIVTKQKNSKNFLKIDYLCEGSYFWRVKGKSGKSFSTKWSRSWKINVALLEEEKKIDPIAKEETPEPEEIVKPTPKPEKKKKRKKKRKAKPTPKPTPKLLPPPALLDDIDARTKQTPIWFARHVVFKPGSLIAAASPSPRFKTLRWSEIEQATGYQLQIAADNNFQKVLVDSTIKEPEYTWTSCINGNFWYRVATINKEKQKGQFSQSARLVIKAKAPELKGPEAGTTIQAKIKRYKKGKKRFKKTGAMKRRVGHQKL